MAEKIAKRRGDRRDGTFIRDIDPMHFITPYLYPHRADNEVYISQDFDLTNLEAYLERKNVGRDKADRYTLFHAIATAFVKVITLRPEMNRFVQGRRIYQRNVLSLAFVVKKQFADSAHEALAFLKFDPDNTIDILHDKIMQEIHACRSDKLDNSTQSMTLFMKFPRWLMRIAVFIMTRMDFFGVVPYSLVKTDPAYATVFFSNLGSIKLDAAYHHLVNWGTNSLFVTIGQKHRKPVFREDGTYDMRNVLTMGITIDERIADGYYYAQTVHLLKKLIECPELLDRPANEEVEL